MFKVGLVTGCLVLFSLSSIAQNNLETFDYIIPAPKDVIKVISESPQKELSARFKILNWNIEKMKAQDKWVNDFHMISAGVDLFTIQEGVSDSFFQNELIAKNFYEWVYFISWVRDEDLSSSGLVTGGVAKSVSRTFARTDHLEPIIKTPKLTSANNYKIQGLDKELMLLNIHAINFVSKAKFKSHIAKSLQLIKNHRGPVIFVGDFNTWNDARFELLIEMTAAAGLKFFDFKRPDVSGFHSGFDHFFGRGIKVNKIEMLDIRSSDHFPILADVTIL